MISNVFVYWNTRYIAHALETLERQRPNRPRRRHPPQPPLHVVTINPFGHYRFATRRGPAK